MKYFPTIPKNSLNLQGLLFFMSLGPRVPYNASQGPLDLSAGLQVSMSPE